MDRLGVEGRREQVQLPVQAREIGGDVVGAAGLDFGGG
jgi:hypothetical protein